MDQKQISKQLERVVHDLVPEIKNNCTRQAKVSAVHKEGGIADLWRRRFYAVDLIVLDSEGEEDPGFETLFDVELPQVWGRSGGGVFARPQVGSILRVGFDYGDKDKPYIVSGTNRGMARIPGGEAGEYLVQFAKRIYWMIDRLGNFIFKTSGKITQEAGSKDIIIEGTYSETSGTRSIKSGSLTVETSKDFSEEVLGARVTSAGSFNVETEGDQVAMAGGKRSAIVTETDREVVVNSDADPIAKQLTAVLGDIAFEAKAGNIELKAALLIGISNQLTSLLELTEIQLDLLRDFKVINWTGSSITTPDVKAAVEMLRLQYKLLLKG